VAYKDRETAVCAPSGPARCYRATKAIRSRAPDTWAFGSMEAKGPSMSVQYPIPATIAVVFRGSDVLLVRRANPPDVGRWGFPGGKIERGETIMRAAERELFEETSVVGKARHVLTAVDAFDRSLAGAVLHHFVLVAVLCGYISGVPHAADDVTEAYARVGDRRPGAKPGCGGRRQIGIRARRESRKMKRPVPA
jgi:8-oxo-dGTP diphosphatase